MKRFEVYNSSYEGKLPKITHIYNGYHGLKKGIGIHCNSKFVPLVLPVNERGYQLKGYTPYISGVVGMDFKLTFKQKLQILFCSKLSVAFVSESLKAPAHPMCRCSVQPVSESEDEPDEKA